MKGIRPGEFDSVILDSVDEGLSVLGEGVRKALYFQIERKDKLKRTEIPARLELFHNALERIFGPECFIIEVLIAKALYRRLKLKLEPYEDWVLKDYVSNIIVEA